MHTTKKIIIIGGGIGGVASAFALERAGFDVTVYERTQQLREVGAGIALWANATHVLNQLGLLSDAMTVSQLTTNYQFNSQNGKELVNIPVNRFELPVLAIHRADLHSLLYHQLPKEKFVFGQTFEGFEQRENCVLVHFTSGLTSIGDALIGADGLRSTVRAALLGDGLPIYRNFTSWRGLTDYVPNTYRCGYIHEFLGPGKGFGFMMLGKGRMYWYAAAKAFVTPSQAAIEHKKQLQSMFQDWFGAIGELIAATDETHILKTDLYDRRPTLPWSQQNITLLGDAAHPMLPTMGQGACTALEDALVLAKCLHSCSDPTIAFQHYQLQRFQRTKLIVEQSLQSARMGELQNPIAVKLRNTFIKLISSVIENSFTSLHTYRA